MSSPTIVAGLAAAMVATSAAASAPTAKAVSENIEAFAVSAAAKKKILDKAFSVARAMNACFKQCSKRSCITECGPRAMPDPEDNTAAGHVRAVFERFRITARLAKSLS